MCHVATTCLRAHWVRKLRLTIEKSCYPMCDNHNISAGFVPPFSMGVQMDTRFLLILTVNITQHLCHWNFLGKVLLIYDHLVILSKCHEIHGDNLCGQCGTDTNVHISVSTLASIPGSHPFLLFVRAKGELVNEALLSVGVVSNLLISGVWLLVY